MSCVVCHVSHVMCPMSCGTCHVSHVICHIYIFFISFLPSLDKLLKLVGVGPTPSRISRYHIKENLIKIEEVAVKWMDRLSSTEVER